MQAEQVAGAMMQGVIGAPEMGVKRRKQVSWDLCAIQPRYVLIVFGNMSSIQRFELFQVGSNANG